MLEVQSGVVGGDVKSPAWHIGNGSGVRKNVFHVDFKPNFTRKPQVVVGLTHIDAVLPAGTRISVDVEDVTTDGCDVISTWADTKIAGAHASWLALSSHPNSHPETGHNRACSGKGRVPGSPWAQDQYAATSGSAAGERVRCTRSPARG